MYRSSRKITASIFVTLILVGAMGCSHHAPTSGKVVKSGEVELTLPDGYEQKSFLSGPNSTGFANLKEKENFVDYHTPKASSGAKSLQEFADLSTQKLLKQLKDGKATALKSVSISGQAALQAELSGELNLKSVPGGVTYLVTFCEDKTSYHQLMGWTIQSHFSEARPTFEFITNSFKSSTT